MKWYGLETRQKKSMREQRQWLEGKHAATPPLARGHIDCLEIVNGERVIARAIPLVYVNDKETKVTDAAIGSIDKKQMQTFVARGLDEEEAIEVSVRGILG